MGRINYLIQFAAMTQISGEALLYMQQPEHPKAFQVLKQLIAESPVLTSNDLDGQVRHQIHTWQNVRALSRVSLVEIPMEDKKVQESVVDLIISVLPATPSTLEEIRKEYRV